MGSICSAGVLTGMGAATADTLYGSPAGFGLTGLIGLLVAGVFTGSLAWWAILSSISSIFKTSLKARLTHLEPAHVLGR